MVEITKNLNEIRSLVEGFNYYPDEDEKRYYRAINDAVWEMIIDAPKLEFCSVPMLALRKPTINQTKKSFTDNVTALETALDASKKLNNALCFLSNNGEYYLNWLGDYGRFSENNEETEEEADKADDLYFASQSYLVHRLANSYGYSHFLLEATARIQKDIEKKIELEMKEAKFWNLSHRAPNYFARAIALRLAYIFAAAHLKKPTYGTNNSNIPSTSYTKVLEKIYAALSMEIGFMEPAKWAVKQVRPEDIERSKSLAERNELADKKRLPGIVFGEEADAYLSRRSALGSLVYIQSYNKKRMPEKLVALTGLEKKIEEPFWDADEVLINSIEEDKT